MAATATLPSLTKLNAENWAIWADSIETHAHAMGCWDVIDPEAAATPAFGVETPGNGVPQPVESTRPAERLPAATLEPASAATPATDAVEASPLPAHAPSPPPTVPSHSQKEYEAKNNKAIQLIKHGLEDTERALLIGERSAARAWHRLKLLFGQQNEAVQSRWMTSLWSTEYQEGQSMREFFAKYQRIKTGIVVAGGIVTENMMASAIMQALSKPSSPYGSVVLHVQDQMMGPGGRFTFDKLFAIMLNAEARMLAQEKPPEVVHAVPQPRFTPKGACFTCNEVGHFARDCKFSYCSVCKKHGCHQDKHGKSSGWQGKGRGYQQGHPKKEPAPEMNAIAAGLDPLVDSGASCSVFPNAGDFANYQAVSPEPVKLAGNNTFLQVVGKGTIVLESLVDGCMRTIRLRNCLHVPGLTQGLISVSQLRAAGFKVEYPDDFPQLCTILHGDVVVGVARDSGGVYRIVKEAWLHSTAVNMVSISPNVSALLWHRRFGHASMERLQTLARDGLIDGLQLKDVEGDIACEPCMQGKLVRNRFPHVATHRAQKVLELVHSDLCGPMECASLGGRSYFITFTDDFSRFVWIKTLRQKSEALEAFKEYKALMENQLGTTIKELRSDNGGEYTSNAFVAFLKDHGIRHQLSVPYNPQQNGVAERMNRTLLDMVRVMLLESQLPKAFWGGIGPCCLP